MNVPDDLLYTESHEWVRREGDKIRVGITDHAQAELTDVVYVELPKMGAVVRGRRHDRSRRIGQGGERHLRAGQGHGRGSEQSARIQSGLDQYRSLRRRLDLSPASRKRGPAQSVERRRRLSCLDRLTPAGPVVAGICEEPNASRQGLEKEVPKASRMLAA